jgi:hypothetical protein
VLQGQVASWRMGCLGDGQAARGGGGKLGVRDKGGAGAVGRQARGSEEEEREGREEERRKER